MNSCTTSSYTVATRARAVRNGGEFIYQTTRNARLRIHRAIVIVISGAQCTHQLSPTLSLFIFAN